MTGLRSSLVRFRFAPGSLAAFLVACCVGCGVESYESRMNETIAELKHSNKFIGLDKKFTKLIAPGNEAAVAIVPKIKLPVQPSMLANNDPDPFTAYSPASADPLNPKEAIPSNRIFPPPPLPEVPGYQMSFEKYVATTSSNRVWHLYVGVVRHEPNSGGSLALTAKILDHAKAENGKIDTNKEPKQDESELVWRDVSVVSARPEAPARVWKVLDINRFQSFYVNGSNILTDQPGTCRFMVLDVPGPAKSPVGDHQVVLIWRYSKNTIERQRIENLMTASVGTLEIDFAPPAAPAPK